MLDFDPSLVVRLELVVPIAVVDVFRSIVAWSVEVLNCCDREVGNASV